MVYYPTISKILLVFKHHSNLKAHRVQTIGHIYLLQHLQDIQLLRFSPKIYKLESFESQILNIFVDYLNAYFLFAVTKRFFQDLNVGL